MKFGELKLTDVDKVLLKAASDAGMEYATINRIYPVDEDNAASEINAEVVGLGFRESDLAKVTHRFRQTHNEGEWVEF